MAELKEGMVVICDYDVDARLSRGRAYTITDVRSLNGVPMLIRVEGGHLWYTAWCFKQISLENV